MVEYGGAVRQVSGGGNPGGSGMSGAGGDLVDFITDIVGRIAAQPPEILLIVAAIIVVGGFLVTRRSI